MTDAPTPRLDLATLRRLPKGIWALGLVSLLMDVSSEMIHALLPVFLVGTLGASTIVVGVIEGVAEAAASMTKVFSGALSDFWARRKPLAVAGYLLAALTKPVFPLAGSVGWLVAARVTDRIGKGIRGAPRDALVADISPPGLRGASFGLRQSLDTVGAVFGPLVALGLMWALSGNIRLVFWFAVPPAILAVAVLLVAVREPERPAGLRRVRAPLSRAELARLGKPLWVIVTVAGLFTLARFSEAFLILKASDSGLQATFAPAVLAVMSVVYALSAFPAGVLSDMGGRVPVLTTGLLVLIAADLVLAFADGLWAVWIGVALWGVHMGLTQGVFAGFVADTAPEELRGTAFGVFNLVAGFATLCASVIAGALWEMGGPSATFLAGALAAGATLVMLPWLARVTARRATS
jgi:MFS family permease